MGLTISIVGHNEAYHLEELLPELIWANEIIYVDAGSSDNSISIAKKYTDKVFARKNNSNLNVNKSVGIENATQDWIFYLDPDERIPQELKEEILQIISSNSAFVAYKLSRKNHFFGKWLKYGSQYPDKQLRLFRNGKAKFPNKHVHEKLQIDGSIGNLKNDMLHFAYLSTSQFIKKFDFYTTFDSEFMFNNDVEITLKNTFIYIFHKPITRFFRRFILKRGFKDGFYGFWCALFDAMGYAVRYVKLYEIYENKKKS